MQVLIHLREQDAGSSSITKCFTISATTYLVSFRHSMPPRDGFAIGLERFLMQLLDFPIMEFDSVIAASHPRPRMHAHSVSTVQGPAVGHRRIAVAVVLLVVVARARTAAADSSCGRAAACCPEHIEHDAARHVMSVGVIVMGLSGVNERAGTWDADFYLYEEWEPAAGFAPQTEVVNEVERRSTQFEMIALRDGVCIRSRRIHSTLRAPFNLHTFPFDHQALAIELSDDEYVAGELVYQGRPSVIGFDDAVRTTLSGWKLDSDLAFARETRAFRAERGGPAYDYAAFRFEIRRHVTFHLIKFFLPLLLIVALAFSVFWIDADDLGAALTVGVTCLLAVIAFQFAEASALPEVAYLTLADRVYVGCYVAVAVAVFETIYTSSVSRRGDKDRALRIDRRCRKIFPAAVVIALIASIVRAFTEG